VGVLYGSLNVGIRSVESGREKGEIYQRVRMTREIVSRELRSAYLTPSSSDWTVFLGDEFFGGAEGDGGEEGEDRRIAIRGEDLRDGGMPEDRLTFDSFVGYPDGSRVLAAVRIEPTREDVEGKRDLMLVRRPLYGPMPPDTLILAEGIAGLDIRYLQAGEDGGSEWVESWDSESELPEAIEITILHPEEEGRPRITELPILLHIPERPVR
jgi:hypothetical protein